MNNHDDLNVNMSENIERQSSDSSSAMEEQLPDQIMDSVLIEGLNSQSFLQNTDILTISNQLATLRYDLSGILNEEIDEFSFQTLCQELLAKASQDIHIKEEKAKKSQKEQPKKQNMINGINVDDIYAHLKKPQNWNNHNQYNHSTNLKIEVIEEEKSNSVTPKGDEGIVDDLYAHLRKPQNYNNHNNGNNISSTSTAGSSTWKSFVSSSCHDHQNHDMDVDDNKFQPGCAMIDNDNDNDDEYGIIHRREDEKNETLMTPKHPKGNNSPTNIDKNDQEWGDDDDLLINGNNMTLLGNENENSKPIKFKCYLNEKLNEKQSKQTKGVINNEKNDSIDNNESDDENDSLIISGAVTMMGHEHETLK